EVSTFVENERAGYIHTLISLESPSRAFTTAQSLQVKAQALRAFSAQRLQPLGVTLERQETIPAFNMLVARVPINRVNQIKSLSRVRAVSRNKFISVSDYEQLESGDYPTPEEISSFHSVGELPTCRENMTVAVVDSGSPRADWVEKAVTVTDSNPIAEFFHGAAVSRVVHGVAPNAELVSVKTLGPTGTARLSTVIDGIQKAATMEPSVEVVNLSIGTSPSLFSPLDRACNTVLREYGVSAIIVSAGNTGDEETSPATAESTVSVGALDETGRKVASYSAKDYDILAIGNVEVEALGETMRVRGTSFSAPVVSAMFARRLSGDVGVPYSRVDA
ncbi:MAG: S8 family serine peptidase, partial [Candidatus Nanohaloarchaea archaeon]|nr:S8 family serine peptidase [Candidatus Nanohaloarchaea archaeon]